MIPGAARAEAGARHNGGVLEDADGIVLAGGRGRRLGGASKADLDVSGRLLDRVLGSLAALIGGRILVVAPEEVALPRGVLRAMESPAGGGPLAGVGAGLEALSGSGAAPAVLITSVDSPGIGLFAPRLFEALRARPEADGAIARGGEPEAFDQYLQGVYRRGVLVDCLTRLARKRLEAEGRAGDEPRPLNVIHDTICVPSGKCGVQSRNKDKGGCTEIPATPFGGGLHGYGVRRALHGLALERVEVGRECRDLDTPEDLAWWRRRLSGHSEDSAAPR